ncbi:Two-component response regulator-like PRR95 isoform D [Glycine soja]|uniref:Two-component response regulator-like PRR95 isoform D n=1 Tax=Glycine soja TaxID=3848 RepID=A0A445LHG0_GLYSO|nr:Two-component response regulator-like PRR95 isoform D [Glycine soja]
MGLVAADKGSMQTQEEQSDNASAVQWERFLPRMVLRVLLVEADDSTRQIISALLHKCSYKVMSSHDSVSMVLKCMLKGAADFLIKPVRRNELRNLWQHVWRRHAISRPPQNFTLPEIEIGFAAENHAASNDSSGSVASTAKNGECSEKTSEAQDISQLKRSSNLSNIDTVKHENSTKCERESDKHNDEAGEKSLFVSEDSRCNKTFKPTGLRLGQGYECCETRNQDVVLKIELIKSNPEINTDIHGCSDELVDPYTGAIDLIATFKNLPKSTDEKCSFSSGNTAKFDFDTQLELSLRRRDFPGSSCKAASEERQLLNHSNASAFSRYSSSKLLQPLFPTPSTISAKLTNSSLSSHESHKFSENASTSHQYGGKNQNQEKIITPVIGQSGQVDPKLPNSQLGYFPATGVTSDHKSTGNGNVFPSMLYAESGVHPIWTPKSVCQKESSPFPTITSSQSNPQSHNSECHLWSEDSTHASDKNLNDQINLDCETHDSPDASQSAGTSFFHDTANHNSSGVYRSMGCRSDGNATSAKVAKESHGSFIDSGHCSYDGFIGTDSHRTSHREAALTKFRLKRKDRCYEKKVRYQSRKRLAEQRPRVKGQFVRQVQDDHPVADVGGGS